MARQAHHLAALRAEMPVLQADTLRELAEVQRLMGQAAAATASMAQAGVLYAAKGDKVSAGRAALWCASAAA